MGSARSSHRQGRATGVGSQLRTFGIGDMQCATPFTSSLCLRPSGEGDGVTPSLLLAISSRADFVASKGDGGRHVSRPRNSAAALRTDGRRTAEERLGVNSSLSLLTIGSRADFIASKWHRSHAAHPERPDGPFECRLASRPSRLNASLSQLCSHLSRPPSRLVTALSRPQTPESLGRTELVTASRLQRG